MSTRARREREKEKRRNDIIKAAEKRFFKKGYDEVSMDEIAQDVELSKGTLYLYFKNKQSLYFAIVIRGMKKLLDYFIENTEKESTGLRKVLAISNSFLDYMTKYSHHYRLNLSARQPRFTSMLTEGEIDDAEVYFQLTLDLLNIVKDSVILGIQDGTIRKSLDPVMTTMFLGSTLEASVAVSPENRMLLSQLGLDMKIYTQHSMDVLLRGIAGEKAKISSR